MGSKGDVVSCIYQGRVNILIPGGLEHPEGELDVYGPAFFSSSDKVFQSLLWSSSSCWWMVSCSSAVNFSHWASTLDSGMTASLARGVVVAAAEREREKCLLATLMGRTRRAACIWEVRERCKVCELKNGTRRSGCLFL